MEVLITMRMYHSLSLYAHGTMMLLLKATSHFGYVIPVIKAITLVIVFYIDD